MHKFYGIHPVVVLANIQATTASANFGRKSRRNSKRLVATVVGLIAVALFVFGRGLL